MLNDERGQTTTEYGLILVILSIAAIGVLSIAAGSVVDLYQDASGLVGTAIDSVLT